MNAPKFRYSKVEPIPGDTGPRFDCPENGYYNMTAAEMEREDARESASRATDRREPATGEPGGEATRPEARATPAVQGLTERLYDAIEQVLLHYRGGPWVDEDGDPLGLVDVLTPAGERSVAEGQHQIRLICDAIYNDDGVRAALSAPEQAAQSPELSAEPPELTTGASEAAQQADARDAAKRSLLSEQMLTRIFDVLQWYGNLATYMAPRVGGVLAGCPRGELPRPDDLVKEAQRLLKDFEPLARAAMAASKKEG